MPAIGPMGVPPFMGTGYPGFGFGMGGPFPGAMPGMSGPALTGGSPFFPGAPGIPPMVNTSLNYLQNLLMKQEEENKRLEEQLKNINSDDGNFDAIAKRAGSDIEELKINFFQMGVVLDCLQELMLFPTILDLSKTMFDLKILKLKREQWYHFNTKTMII